MVIALHNLKISIKRCIYIHTLFALENYKQGSGVNVYEYLQFSSLGHKSTRSPCPCMVDGHSHSCCGKAALIVHPKLLDPKFAWVYCGGMFTSHNNHYIHPLIHCKGENVDDYIITRYCKTSFVTQFNCKKRGQRLWISLVKSNWNELADNLERIVSFYIEYLSSMMDEFV